MIPKKIHYCWFGGKTLPADAEACIKSWAEKCPDYALIRWDEQNVSLEDSLYARQAYEAEKWAFVSDYVRLKALWEQGGIYMDTDVEVLHPLDRFLTSPMFMGFESRERVATCIIGAEPKSPFIGTLLETYRTGTFLRTDGSFDCTTNVERITEALKKRGLRTDGTLQVVEGITVYPSAVFSPKSLETGRVTLTLETCTIHHFNASWMTQRQKRHTRIAQILGPRWAKIAAKVYRSIKGSGATP